MNSKLLNYIKYGAYNNTICFPEANADSVKKYIKGLKDLPCIIKNECSNQIVSMLRKEDSNVIVISYIFSMMAFNQNLYELLKTKIDSFDKMHIVVFFLKYGCFNKKIINRLYEDKFEFLSKDLFKISKPKIKTLLKFNKRSKVLKKVKKDIKNKKANKDTLIKIKANKISPFELMHYTSYFFDKEIKEKLFLYFIETYNVLESLKIIECSFSEVIPNSVLEKIKEKISNINTIEEIYELILLHEKINNKEIKDIIYNFISSYKTEKNEKNVFIHLAANNKSRMKADKDEKYTYLNISGILGVLISKKFNTELFVNNHLIEDDSIMKMKNKINDNLVCLNPAKKTRKTGKNKKIEILFSDSFSNNYDIVWNVMSKDLEFDNYNKYLLVKGFDKKILPCVTKYINHPLP